MTGELRKLNVRAGHCKMEYAHGVVTARVLNTVMTPLICQGLSVHSTTIGVQNYITAESAVNSSLPVMQ